MTGKILLIEGDIDRRWRLSQAIGRVECLPGGVAEILFGDFEQARAEATVGVLRRNLPVNEIHVVRSGCEALEFLRRRGSPCKPENPLPPVLAILDEDLSGMAGHSILRSVLNLPSLGEMMMIIHCTPAVVPRSRRLPGKAVYVPEVHGLPPVSRGIPAHCTHFLSGDAGVKGPSTLTIPAEVCYF
jgi:CheY-like chemotaxis protein